VLGYDVVATRLEEFAANGGTTVMSTDEIYSTCDVIMQMLPTHETIQRVKFPVGGAAKTTLHKQGNWSCKKHQKLMFQNFKRRT
jgi:3-hydroxyisobutyrate dehydrogenase-like beta-hydroxyacid dehydrogenase